MSGLLKEGEVRDVVWDGGRGKVYFGDNLGRVAVTSLPKVVCIHLGSYGILPLLPLQSVKKSGLLRRSNEVIFQDRSAVVQLVCHFPTLSCPNSLLLPLRISMATCWLSPPSPVWSYCPCPRPPGLLYRSVEGGRRGRDGRNLPFKVGRKSRDGQFGGCLDVRDGKLLAYSARPGGRLWEVQAALLA